MKPNLHIIGLGSDRLDKLSLETYKLLAKTKNILVWSFGHPAVTDLIQEGFFCAELFPEDEMRNQGEDWKWIVNHIIKAVDEFSGMENVLIALPGHPLKEGRIVSELTKAFAEKYNVNVSLLVQDGSMERLSSIMAELRSPWGCVWDKEQTHEKLKKYLIEETYEVIEAIDAKNMNNFCEELGDLLLQVVFHSQIAQEAGVFSLSDIVKGISDKLVRRHPHVFGSVQVTSSEDVLVNWDVIKKREKERDFFHIPKGLPALLMAEDAQKKAAKAGFDWGDYKGPLGKIYEELAEMEKELDNNQRLEDELGDLLFSIVNLSRFLGINAEEALRQGTKKFQQRFNKMLGKIQEESLKIEELDLEEMDFFWNKVKNEEKNGTFGSF